MKTLKIVLALAVATVGFTGLARAADEAKKEGKPAACCAKAEADGAKCAHECCVAAAKDGKACEKCGGSNEKAS